VNPRLYPGLRATGPLLRTQSDERLATMAANGSDAAFEAIVARYWRTLVRHCAGIVGYADAEEAVQDALVRAHGALRRGGPEIRDLRAWLHVIAHNAALNVLRSRSTRPGPAPPGCEPADVSAPRPAEEREQLGELVAAIRALSDRERDAIVMHELEGRTWTRSPAASASATGPSVSCCTAPARRCACAWARSPPGAAPGGHPPREPTPAPSAFSSPDGRFAGARLAGFVPRRIAIRGWTGSTARWDVGSPLRRARLGTDQHAGSGPSAQQSAARDPGAQGGPAR